MSNAHKFAAYRNAAQSISAGTWTKVGFDTTDFDTSSNFSTSLNRFIAPVAGFYMINWMVGIPISPSSNTDNVSSLYKNGTTYQWASEVTTPIGSGGVAIIQLAANDYLEVFVYVSTATAALNVGSSPRKTYMQGFLISAA